MISAPTTLAAISKKPPELTPEAVRERERA
jgi:hypothetical protein